MIGSSLPSEPRRLGCSIHSYIHITFYHLPTAALWQVRHHHSVLGASASCGASGSLISPACRVESAKKQRKLVATAKVAVLNCIKDIIRCKYGNNVRYLRVLLLYHPSPFHNVSAGRRNCNHLFLSLHPQRLIFIKS